MVVPRQGAVRSYQRFLRCILGVLAAAEHSRREAQACRRVSIDERRERRRVSVEHFTNTHGIGHLRRVIPADRVGRHMTQGTTISPTVPLKSSSVVANPGGAIQWSPFTRMLIR